jgi:hypothetical protein
MLRVAFALMETTRTVVEALVDMLNKTALKTIRFRRLGAMLDLMSRKAAGDWRFDSGEANSKHGCAKLAEMLWDAA